MGGFGDARRIAAAMEATIGLTIIDWGVSMSTIPVPHGFWGIGCTVKKERGDTVAPKVCQVGHRGRGRDGFYSFEKFGFVLSGSRKPPPLFFCNIVF